MEIQFTDYVQYQTDFQRKKMISHIFYFNPTAYNSYSMSEGYFCTPTFDNNIIYFPFIQQNPLQNTINGKTQQQVLFSPISSHSLDPSSNAKKNQESTTQIPKKGKTKIEEEVQNQQQEEFILKQGKAAINIYKKKNTESNIANQAFSYISCQRSKKMVLTLTNNDAGKTREYFRIMAKIKQGSKKYINRKYLRRLIQFQKSSEFYKAFLKSKSSLMTHQEVKRVIRSLIFYYLREQSNITLLTSTKIYKQTLCQHFWRKREILQFIFSKSITNA